MKPGRAVAKPEMRMQDVEYSYLDLTVMPFLRKKVISSDSVILFRKDFARVLWANAVGTQLFGGHGIADLLDTRLSPRHPLVGQLINASRQISGDESITRGFRIQRGLKSELIQGELTRVRLPRGETAIMLSCPASELMLVRREHELAAMAVEALDGFADAAAIIDEYGLVLAASDGFEGLDIDPFALEGMVREVTDEEDRLVKRPVESGDGRTIAVGLGRIRDVPARYLVVFADTSAGMDAGEFAEEPEAEATDVPSDFAGHETIDADDAAGDLDYPVFAGNDIETGDGAPEPDAGMELPATEEAGSAAGEPDIDRYDTGAPEELAGPESIEPELTGHDLAGEEDTGAENAVSQTDTWQDREADVDFKDEAANDLSGGMAEDADEPADGGEAAPSLIDRWYFNDHARRDDAARGEKPETGGNPASAEGLSAGDGRFRSTQQGGQDKPLTAGAADEPRFALIIDSGGIIRSVSPELGQTVGPKAADIAGLAWADAAARLGIDENGAIGRLLEKADTWSGKSVLWPVEGTDLAYPVDLAALPVFDRERRFDGFRGFGIIRKSDAVIDPAARGIALGHDREPGSDAEHRTQKERPEARIFEDETAETMPAERWRQGTSPSQGIPSQGIPSQSVPGQGVPSPAAGSSPATTIPATSPRETGAPSNVLPLRARTEPEGLSRREAQAFSEIRETLEGETAGAPAGEASSPPASRHSNADTALAGSHATENGQTAMDEAGHPSAAPGNEPARSDRPHADDILDTLPHPVLVYRPGRILFANEELLARTGYRSEEDLEAAGGVGAILGSTVLAEGTTGHGMELRPRDGAPFPVRATLKSVPWHDGKALCLTFETNRPEVRDTRPLIDMLRVSELESILETAADGIVIISADGRIESLNPPAEALFGRPTADMAGLPFASLFAEESRKTVSDCLASLAGSGPADVLNQGREAIGLEAGGGLIPLYVTVGRVGRSGKSCAVLRDLTQWKKSEEELVQAKRRAETASEQKTEFLSRISHEIREPLNAIIGFSDVMIEERFGPVGNERYREYLKDINRSGIHVLELVNDLLDISKIEAGKLELSFEAVDLNQLAAETVALLQPQANNNRIIIRTSLSRAVPKVVADPRSVRQIILNLVSNAIRHSPPNNQVIVSTVYDENGEVGIRVRDTGKGMSEEEIERALEPFTQIGSGPEGKRGGTGLGLPLTKALVEANRAYFELESRPGEGTIAHIQFPTQRVLAD